MDGVEMQSFPGWVAVGGGELGWPSGMRDKWIDVVDERDRVRSICTQKIEK